MSSMIGNTVVQDLFVYEGTPFASISRNKEVLASLFVGNDCKIEEGKDEDSNQLVAVTMPAKVEDGIGGSNIQCRIRNDRISVAFLFPQQSIDELASGIYNTRPIVGKIYEKLLEIYGLSKTPPDLYGKQWDGETKNVPCLKWLKERLILKPNEIDLEKCLDAGWTISDIRTVQCSFAIQTLPPGVQNAPESIQRKMESLSTFIISVVSAADWNKGLGMIRAIIRDMNPSVYTNILKLITL